MRKLLFIITLSLSLYSASLSKSGNNLGVSGLFSQSSVTMGLKLGSASIGSETYTIGGLSVNYFVLNGLSVGLGYESWFSGEPGIQKLTAESTYFIPAGKSIRPYLGLLYRRILISGFNDTNAYGYRAGLAFVRGKLLLSAGVVQERHDSTGLFLKERQTYGEFTVGFAF